MSKPRRRLSGVVLCSLLLACSNKGNLAARTSLAHVEQHFSETWLSECVGYHLLDVPSNLEIATKPAKSNALHSTSEDWSGFGETLRLTTKTLTTSPQKRGQTAANSSPNMKRELPSGSALLKFGQMKTAIIMTAGCGCSARRGFIASA